MLMDDGRRRVHKIIGWGVGACWLLLAGPSTAPAALTWVQATQNAAWSGREFASALAFNNRMWIIAGRIDSSNGLRDCYFSTNGVNWTAATTNAPWIGRARHTSAVFNGRMWVMGGWPSTTNDVWYSTDGGSWTLGTSQAAWPARQLHACVAFDNKMWVMGGQDGGGGRDVWSTASADGSSWSQATATAAWSTRSRMPALAHAGRMWMLGGYDGSERNDVWYSTNGADWSLAGNAGWSGRYDHAAVVGSGRIWVCGGTNNPGQVWYSPDGAAWTMDTAAAPFPNRLGHTMLSHAGRIWVLGGSAGGVANDVWSAEVCAPPSVTGQPMAQTACEGGMATFSVTAEGSAPLAYQWRQDATPIGGATGSSYTIDPVAPDDAGNYDVVINNACGSATSAAAALTVQMQPSIITPPSDVTATGCSPAVFTVSAAGGGLSYQWRREGGALSDTGHYSGTTAATLTITPVSSQDEGDYDVVVTNQCGSVISDSATLAIDWSGRTDCNTNGVPDDCDVGGGDRVWIGGDGAAFSGAGNWSPAGIPGTVNTAVFTNTGSADNRSVLDVTGTTRICGLTIEGAGSGRQILEIGWRNTAVFMDVVSGSRVSTGGWIDLRGGFLAGGPVEIAGGRVGGYGEIRANVTNGGEIEAGPVRPLVIDGAAFANDSNALLLAPVGTGLLIRAGAVIQRGEIEVRSSGGVVFETDVINEAGGLITLLGGALSATSLTNEPSATIFGFGTIHGNVSNDGAVNCIADMQIVGDLHNDGTIVIQNGILTVTGNLTGTGVIIGGFGG